MRTIAFHLYNNKIPYVFCFLFVIFETFCGFEINARQLMPYYVMLGAGRSSKQVGPRN